MSILSQIIVVLLILLTGVILVYANKGLSNAAEEGEHFVDEWALRQVKKEEKSLERLQKKEEKSLERLQKKAAKSRKHGQSMAENNTEDFMEEIYPLDGEECYPEGEDIFDAIHDAKDAKKEQFDQNQMPSGNFRIPDNVVPLHKAGSEGMELMLWDDNRNLVDVFHIEQYPYYIGRGKDNHLVLNDLSVAMHHCKIVESDGTILLKDLGTANKIYADGEIVEECILTDQGRFYIGNYEFQASIRHHKSQRTILASKPEKLLL